MEKSKRKHIGVLCSTIDIANQYDIWKGIVEVAAVNDIHLTAYISTYQTTDNSFYSFLESCFDTMFKNSELLDGLIVLAGFIAQNVGLEEFGNYAQKLPRDMPMVSVSFELPGIPSIVTYNKSGMHSAVDHLIRVHGKKHIAFIKGPDGHPEAEARLQGYKDALLANGIPFDDNYLFQGDFGREYARRAIPEMYDVRGLSVDAIACCNDQSAVGVLQALKKRDIMVPTDVAITGFDDDIVSTIYVPAISTVGQDFVRLGQISAELLVERIDGKKLEDVTHILPEFIPRQSCGCLGGGSVYDDSESIGAKAGRTFGTYVTERFVELLKKNAPKEQILEWAEILLGKIVSEPFTKDDFIAALDRILVTYYHSYSTEFSAWHEALITLAVGIEIHKDEFDDVCSILSTLMYATTLVYNIRIREEKKREYTQSDERKRKVRNTNALLLMFDVASLEQELYKTISVLSMKMALIGIYEHPVKKGAREERIIRAIIGFDGEDRFNIQHNSWSQLGFTDYSSIEGFDYERERRTLFFQPLFFMDEEVGEMLLPYDPEIPADTYETLRINISTAIKGAMLISTIHTLSVTDELTGLMNRRGFFQFTHSRLYHLRRNEDIVTLVMFMDMDGLKLINDNYGHNEGDEAIRIFANVLKSVMREEDIIGRIGGDEFAVLSSVKSKENAEQLVQRIREAYDAYNEKEQRPYKINGSIGCIVLEDATKECFEAAMLSADKVLYDEKMAKKRQGLTR